MTPERRAAEIIALEAAIALREEVIAKAPRHPRVDQLRKLIGELQAKVDELKAEELTTPEEGA